MKRDLGVERLYPLGDFKNVKFSTQIKDIPEELAQDERAVSLLFLLQALACEVAYREYYAVVDRIAKEKIQDVLGYLQEQRLETIKQLSNVIDIKLEVTETKKETE